MFRLIRTTPQGAEKSQGPVKTARDAAVLASYVLHDNTGLPKREAQEFSARLHKLPLGETLAHDATGYRFRIEKEN